MFFLFHLAEVKGPHTKFHVTPLDACSDPDCLWRSMPVSVTKEEPCKLFMPRCMNKWASLVLSGATLLFTPVNDSGENCLQPSLLGRPKE